MNSHNFWTCFHKCLSHYFARFFAKLLEVYKAVCSHGNNRTKISVKALVDEKQLLYAIENPCMFNIIYM